MAVIGDLPTTMQAAMLFGGGLMVGGVWQLANWLFMNRDPKDFQIGAVPKGARGRVMEWRGEKGLVEIGGERWQAACRDSLQCGDEVKVAAVDGLKLTVRSASRAR